MAEYNVKDNKCLVPVSPAVVKYKDSDTIEIAASDSEYFVFYDDSITETDCAVITVQRIDGDTVDDITTGAPVVFDGGVTVKVFNAGAAAKDVTVICAVI